MNSHKSSNSANTKAAVLSIILAVLTVLPPIFAAVILQIVYPGFFGNEFELIGMGCSVGFLAILSLSGWVIDKRVYTLTIEKFNYARFRETMLSNRSTAIASMAPFYRKIRRVKIFTFLWMLLVGLGFLALSFFSALNTGLGFNYLIIALCAKAFLSIYYRLIYRPVPDFSEAAPKEDFPILYDLAGKAQKAAGLSGDVHIFLSCDGNAAIAKEGKGYSLVLGIYLISLLFEGELYQVMLHEFGHFRAKDPISRYPLSLCHRFLQPHDEDSNIFFDNFFYKLFLSLPGKMNAYIFMICDVATSEIRENKADQTILEVGDPVLGSSALYKVQINNLFDMELYNFIHEPFYSSEEYSENLVRRFVTAVREATESRTEWREILFERELPYAMSSHPIFRERWQAMGSPDFQTVLPDLTADTPYVREIDRAIDFVQAQRTKAEKDNYAAEREQNYLKPLKTVEEFRKLGKDLPATADLPDLLSACESLMEFDLQETLCNRAIEQLNESESVSALFYKGRLLLRRKDAAGIDLLYKASEINPNYVSAAMELIGDFCHWNGLQTEIEEYRRRSTELLQVQIDSDAFDSLSPSDNLSVERFPDDRLPSMLEFMVEAGQGRIARIYLIRKTLRTGKFSSCFVIEFKDKTEGETVNESMHKIFNYLDNYPVDWQYSIFLYTAADPDVIKAVKKVEGCMVWECPVD